MDKGTSALIGLTCHGQVNLPCCKKKFLSSIYHNTPLPDGGYKTCMREVWVCLVILLTRTDKIAMGMLPQWCIISKTQSLKIDFRIEFEQNCSKENNMAKKKSWLSTCLVSLISLWLMVRAKDEIESKWHWSDTINLLLTAQEKSDIKK